MQHQRQTRTPAIGLAHVAFKIGRSAEERRQARLASIASATLLVGLR